MRILDHHFKGEESRFSLYTDFSALQPLGCTCPNLAKANNNALDPGPVS